MFYVTDSLIAETIFIEGHNVKCDESSATGESDLQFNGQYTLASLASTVTAFVTLPGRAPAWFR